MIAPVIGIIGSVVSFMGTLASANAMKQQAEAERQAAEYKAKMEEQQAQEERAVAQRKALGERRSEDIQQSRLQALAAASGGGADDASVVKLGSDLAAQGEYNALARMYTGASRGVDLENQAALDRYSGEARASALRSRANATILGGVGGLVGSLARFG